MGYFKNSLPKDLGLQDSGKANTITLSGLAINEIFQFAKLIKCF